MARDYIERSGDSAFLLTVYPTVLRSILGTLRYHCDSLGFLVHKDAETWMDAAGAAGPWSPRGNRANDIQALWAGQLDAGLWFATRVGDVRTAQTCNRILAQLGRNFPLFFTRGGRVADRLRTDGTRDMSVRPNQMFAGPLLDDSTRARVVRTVTTELTYPHGVASLSQEDSAFHPYHQYPPFYPKDAAYHNGTVWTWLQGPLISALCRFDRQETAFALTTGAIHQILDRGAVGTQSELLDALPRPGETEPRLSGTFSQAWNLAEFIRNIYDDYLGARLDLYENRLTIHPRLPAALDTVRVRLPGAAGPIDIEYTPGTPSPSMTLRTGKLRHPLAATVDMPAGQFRTARCEFSLPPNTVIRLNSRGEAVTTRGRAVAVRTTMLSTIDWRPLLGDLQFAHPTLRPGLRALRGPGYPMLPHDLIESQNPAARVFVDAADPAKDDTGTGSYAYPRNPAFVSGSFDLTHFTVNVDSARAYFTVQFRALSNPGWHPEYGFQLTEIAIALDTDGTINRGRNDIPHNAHAALERSRGYERLILVGGGVQVEDSAGTILAAYVPTAADVTDPLGDASTATIRFALPIRLLGTPDARWVFTLFAGGQDDHGGGGIGEFRAVEREAGEWHGGGKRNTEDTNVYDTLVAQP
jgi:hypothetical protein